MRVQKFGLLALAVVGLVAPSARGQSSPQNKVAAEALFDTAQRLIADGKFSEACPKLEQSQKLDPGIGTLLYLADCYERSGKLASAWATFRDGASQAEAAGQSERAGAGQARAQALEPRLSKLTVKVPAKMQGIDGIELRRDDSPLPKGIWSVPMPIDGGEHVISASAPGYQPWSTTVNVGAEKDDAVVSIPELVPAAAEKPDPDTTPVVPAVAPVPAPAPSPPPQRDRTPHSGTTQRTLGIVVSSVGLVGIGVGSYFGLRAISKNSDAKDVCDGTTCRSESGVTLTDEAKDAATVSNVAFSVGFAALVGGIVLYATAPSEPVSAIHLSPTAGPRSAGLSLGGRFQ
jgi:serine/threonine-protein kinase